MQDFPFTIRDIAWLLNLHIRHKNAVSLDVDCPFCTGKGKLNLNIPKNVFKCNRCGQSGGMLALYGDVYGVDHQTAYEEIRQALGKEEHSPAFQSRKKETAKKEPEITQALSASDETKNRTYTMLFTLLGLSEVHKKNLLERGFTEEQIERNGYKSTPVFGYRKLTKKLLEAGCTVKGVPGFYQDKDGEWTIHFHPKSSGFMIPVRNVEGMIVGVQIRLDRPVKDRKYMWLSSVNYPMGASSGSPIHLAGNPGDATIFITEGPLKGDLAHALSEKTFVCVAGVTQYANLPDFLGRMKRLGTRNAYEAYDMDKLIPTVCRGDYSEEKCSQCAFYRKDWKKSKFLCERKQIKRDNIQRGCRKLAEILKEQDIPGKTLTWDMDEKGEWAEKVKGVDDYLYGLEQRNQKKED